MAQRRVKVKPGKTQSRLGFAVGIVFVLIGCFIAIPVFGPFGIFWTIIAGVITYMNFKNGFTDNGVTTHEIVFEDGSDGTRGLSAEEDVEQKLIKLNSLYEQRLISKEEYDEKRKKLLDEF